MPAEEHEGLRQPGWQIGPRRPAGEAAEELVLGIVIADIDALALGRKFADDEAAGAIRRDQRRREIMQADRAMAADIARLAGELGRQRGEQERVDRIVDIGEVAQLVAAPDLEATLLDVPMVVVYRVTPLTAALAKPLVRTPFFSMVNLIAGKRAVPELIQNDFTPNRVAAEILRLLNDQSARDALRRDLAEVRQRLGPPGAVERAAEAILKLLSSAHGNAK